VARVTTLGVALSLGLLGWTLGVAGVELGADAGGVGVGVGVGVGTLAGMAASLELDVSVGLSALESDIAHEAGQRRLPSIYYV